MPSEPMFPRCETYEELRAELGKLPRTFYPDLIRAMVVAAHEKKVFLPDGATVFVSKVEQEIKRGEIK